MSQKTQKEVIQIVKLRYDIKALKQPAKRSTRRIKQ